MYKGKRFTYVTILLTGKFSQHDATIWIHHILMEKGKGSHHVYKGHVYQQESETGQGPVLHFDNTFSPQNKPTLERRALVLLEGCHDPVSFY